MADKALVLETKFTANITEFMRDVDKIKQKFLGITETAKTVTTAMGKMEAETKKATQSFNESGSSVSQFQKMMGNASGEVAGFRKALYSSSAGLKEYDNLFKLAGKSIKDIDNVVAKNAINIRNQAATLKEGNAAALEYYKSFDRLGMAQKIARGEAEITKKGFKDLTTGVVDAGVKIGVTSDKLAQEAKVMASTRGETSKFQTAMQQLVKTHNVFSTSFETSSNALKKNEQSLQKYIQGLSGSKGVTDAMRKSIVEAGNSIDRMALLQKTNTGELKATAQGFKDVRGNIVDVTKGLGSYASAITSTVSAHTAYSKAVKNSSGSTTNYKSALFQLQKQFGANSDEFKNGVKVLNSVKNATVAWGQSLDAQNKMMGRATGAGREYIKNFDYMSEVNRQLASSTSATANGITVLNNEVKKTFSATSDYSKAVKASANNSIEYKSALFQLQKQFGQNGTAFQLAKKNLDQVYKSTKVASDAAKAHAQQMGVSTKSVSGYASAGQLYNQTLQGMAREADKLNSKQGLLSKAFSNLKSNIASLASYTAAATVIGSISAAAIGAVRNIIEFDQALQNLKAITGATDAELSLMGDKIVDVAKNTKFSAKETADGMTLLGQAGLDAGEAFDAMEATANLAAGTLSDMGKSVDLMSSTLRAFQMEAAESGRVSDVMANAVNKSKLTVEKLRTVFNYVGASANQAGVSLEELAASSMTLANAGVRASTIGTGFRQVLSRMLSPSAKLKVALQDVGLSIQDINPSVAGFETALGNLAQVMVDADGKTINMSKAYSLFGLRGAQAAAVIVRSFLSGQYSEALENVYRVGSAAEMAGIQAEGLGFKFKNLMDRVGTLAIALGDAGLKGALEIIIDSVRSVIDAMTSLAENTLVSTLAKVGVLSVALNGLSVALRALIGARVVAFFTAIETAVITSTGVVAMLSGAFKALWGVIAAHPVGALITAISGLVIATKNMLHYNEVLANSYAKVAAESDNLQKTIDFYSKKLQDAVYGSEAYNNILMRLEKEHPELAKRIKDTLHVTDLSAESYDRLNVAMEGINHEEYVRKVANTQAEIKRYGDQIDTTKKSLIAYRAFEILTGYTLQSHIDAYKSLTPLAEKQAAAIKKLAGYYVQQVASEKISIDQARQMVGALESQDAAFNGLSETFDKVYGKWAENQKRLDSQVKASLAKLPSAYQSAYAGLNALQQAHFSKARIQMQMHLDSVIKDIEESGKSEAKIVEQKNKAKAIIEAQFYAEQTAALYKDFETTAENERRKMELYKEYIKKVEEEYDNATAKRREQYDKDLADAGDNVERKKALEAQFSKDMLNLTTQRGQRVSAVNELIYQKQIDDAKRAGKSIAEIYDQQAKDIENSKNTELAALEEYYRKIIDAAEVGSDKQAAIVAEFEARKQAVVDASNAAIIALRQKQADDELQIAKTKLSKNIERLKSALDEEMSAYSRYYEELNGKHEEAYTKRAQEVERYLTDKTAAIDREFKNESDNVTAMAKMYDQYFSDLKENESEYHANRLQTYKQEYDKITGLLKSKYEENVTIADGNEKQIRALTVQYNKDKKDSYIAYLGKVKEEHKRYADMIVEVIQKEKDEWNTLADKLQDVRDRMKEQTEQYHDDVRSIEQDYMTDAQKYQDDIEEFNRLMNEGREQNDIEYFKEAQALAASLPKVVKDENDKIVINEQETRNARLNMVREANAEIVKNEQETAGAIQTAMKETQERIDEFTAKLAEISTTIDEVSAKKLQIDIGDTVEKVESIRAKIAELYQYIKENDPEWTFKFMGEGSDVKMISEKMAEIEKEFEDLEKKIKSLKPELTVAFKDASTNTFIMAKVTAVLTALTNLATTITQMQPSFTIAFPNYETVLAQINEIIERLEYLCNTKWESRHKIVVEGIDGLKEALKYHEELNGLETMSVHTVVTKHEGEGSTRKPISEKIAEIKQWYSELNDVIAEGAEHVTEFKGVGSDEKYISEKIAEVEAKFKELKEKNSAMTHTTSMRGDAGGGDQSISDAFTTVGQQMTDIKAKASAGVEFVIDTGKTEANLETVTSQLDELYSKTMSLINEAKSELDSLNGDLQSIVNEGIDMQIQKETELRDIRRESMTEAQQQADIQVEANNLMMRAREALAAKDYERAQQMAETAKGLYDDLDDEHKKINGVTRAWDLMISVNSAKEAEKRQAIAEQEEYIDRLYNSISRIQDKTVNINVQDNTETSIEEVNTALDAIPDEVVKVTVDISSAKNSISELQTLLDEIKDKTVKVKVEVEYDEKSSGGKNWDWLADNSAGFLDKRTRSEGGSSLELKRFGGPVLASAGRMIRRISGKLPGGNGQADEVPVLARRGEWYINNEASGYWGDQFMAGINKPFSDMGKMIKGAMAGGAKSMGEYTVNFNVGGESYKVRGDQQNITGLMTAMRRSKLVTV